MMIVLSFEIVQDSVSPGTSLKSWVITSGMVVRRELLFLLDVVTVVVTCIFVSKSMFYRLEVA